MFLCCNLLLRFLAFVWTNCFLSSVSSANRVHKIYLLPFPVLSGTIYVRVYESRMDLLRAVIVGPQGTPYHDGLFVFDVLFPTNYPDVPPVCIFKKYCYICLNISEQASFFLIFVISAACRWFIIILVG